MKVVEQWKDLAKITRPHIRGVHLRESLFAKLDIYRKNPVTWISGPGGSGKTTLANSYLSDRQLPCIWYQVDPGDEDLATFFYYLGLAGKKAVPDRKKPLPLFTPEYLLGVPEFSRNYFSELHNGLKMPFVLVFDNFQEIGASDNFF